MAAEFFQTRMGQRFYESTMPSIAKSLEAIAKRLPVPVDAKEQERGKEAVAWMQAQAKVYAPELQELTVADCARVISAQLQRLE